VSEVSANRNPFRGQCPPYDDLKDNEHATRSRLTMRWSSAKMRQTPRTPLWWPLMFWDSAIAGFSVFGYWEFYAAAVGFLAIAFLPQMFFALLAEHHRIFEDSPLSRYGLWLILRGEVRHGFHGLIECASEGRMAGGLPAYLLIEVCKFFAAYFFILSLLPIILGLSHNAAWPLPWTLVFYEPLVFLKIVGLITVSLVAVSLCPFVNEFESAYMLVYGGIIISIVVKSISGISGVECFPPLWLSIGIIAISFAAKWLILLPPLILGVFMFTWYRHQKLVVLLISPFFFFMPIFIYGGWLALQIRTHLPIEP
jgi:hypothetical protein